MNIKELILLTKPNKLIIEDPNDIEIYDNFIKCKICGGVSGTLKIITHLYYKNNYEIIPCIYKNTITNYNNPIIIGNYNKPRYKINSNIAEGLLQRECTIINSNNSTKIIGSYGCKSCIIVCLRNRITTTTFLCHLDSLTINYKDYFHNFYPNETDVYIVGSELYSINILYILLNHLDNMNFKITFAHVIDNNTNSFAINVSTGDIYLNDDISNPYYDLPIKTYYKYRYNRMLSSLLLNNSYLFNTELL